VNIFQFLCIWCAHSSVAWSRSSQAHVGGDLHASFTGLGAQLANLLGKVGRNVETLRTYPKGLKTSVDEFSEAHHQIFVI
jgi:hypothetical protein